MNFSSFLAYLIFSLRVLQFPLYEVLLIAVPRDGKLATCLLKFSPLRVLNSSGRNIPFDFNRSYSFPFSSIPPDSIRFCRVHPIPSDFIPFNIRQFHSILVGSIPLWSSPLNSIRLWSTPSDSIRLDFIQFQSILFYFISFYSILVGSIPLWSIPYNSIRLWSIPSNSI